MNRAVYILISFILAGMLNSCTTDTTEPENGDDSELIQLIKDAPNKQVIDVSELPSASRNVLETVYGEDIVDASKIAPELGYEIDMMRGQGSRLGEEMQVYFDLTGRELRDGGGRGSGGEEECFEYVLPVTFVMPDGSTITIEDEEDWMEIRNWYAANPGVREEPVIQYPADIIFRDGTTMTLNSDEDLREAYAYCEGR